jgi:predicted transcriptional regulator of viral defense system
MAHTITGLSQREAEFLSRLAADGQTVFRSSEVLHFWSDPAIARRTLSRLCRGGWLKRIERGLYVLVPLDAGPERVWAEDALVIAARLVEPSAVAYWSALHYWNFTEQVPRTVFVQSPRRKLQASLTRDGVHYQLVSLQAERFFGITQSQVGGRMIQVTDREKTILDAADRPDLAGGVRQLAQALCRGWTKLDWVRFDQYLARFGSGALYKRLGYLIEVLDLPIPDRRCRLVAWQESLTTGIALLDPSERAAGPVRLRWRVRDNIDLFGNGTE